MTFQQALAERVKRGEGMTSAIQNAMRDAGIERVTIKDVQRAVAKQPSVYPLAYKRLR